MSFNTFCVDFRAVFGYNLTMVPSEHAPLSLREAVARVVSQMDEPLSRKELVQRILRLHPSQAKKPEELIMAQVRQRVDLVRMRDGGWAPRSWVLRGVVFRYTPSEEELSQGEIQAFPCFTPLLPERDIAQEGTDSVLLTIVDENTSETIVKQEIKARRGSVSLAPWFARERFACGDSMLFTIADSRQPLFLLHREPAEQIDHAAVAIQDATLEAVLTDLVQKNASEQPFLEEILPAALARLHEAARTYPGRHWHDVVQRSSRLRAVDDYAIARATFRRPIDRLLGYAATPAAQRNLEARVDAFNADLQRTLRGINVLRHEPSLPTRLCGRDEALHRSMRQIATFLATQSLTSKDAYRCLAVPSIYLAKHEGVSLAEADFDMLCRFLLSYYPRRVFNNSKPFTGRMLSMLRRFYTAARNSESSAVHVTPHNLSRLHEYVDRKIGLYAEIDLDAPESARLFGKLFPNVDKDDSELLPLQISEIVMASA